MVTLTEGKHEGEFIGELAMGLAYHVDAITLKSGEDLVGGAVLAAVQTGAPTVTVGSAVSGTGGTVGNGTVTITADAGAAAGEWSVEMTSTGATAKFKVVRPDGTVDGVGTVGTAYNGTGSLNVTLADGSNDWTAGDIIPVTISYQDGESDVKYVEYDPASAAPATAILMKDCDASGGAVVTTALVRGPATVNGNDLAWITGITADQKTGAKASLLANSGIKVA